MATEQGVFNTLAQYLKSLGLGALFTVDSKGAPGGWLWNQIQSGIDTDTELMPRLEQTDVYRDRFSVIVEQQRRAAAGEPVTVMTPGDVLDYERQARQLMSAAGMPKWFYDEPKDFSKLMLADISPKELQDRIGQAYDYVLSAPPEVRAAFTDFYGVGKGDAALAAWALDPERTVRDIGKATRTAYAAGMATRFDIGIDRATAERIADLPLTEEGISSGLQQVAGQESLFEEGIGEAADITVGDGIEAVFENDPEANKKLARRVGERRSIERSNTGGALMTNEGLIGAGTS